MLYQAFIGDLYTSDSRLAVSDQKRIACVVLVVMLQSADVVQDCCIVPADGHLLKVISVYWHVIHTSTS